MFKKSSSGQRISFSTEGVFPGEMTSGLFFSGMRDDQNGFIPLTRAGGDFLRGSRPSLLSEIDIIGFSSARLSTHV